MSHKKMETGLIVVKNTKFDKIRNALFRIFFYKEYKIMQRLDELLKVERKDVTKIVIPKEIKNFKL